MRVGVAGSIQFTGRMMELCEQLEGMVLQAFMGKFGPYFVGKTDEQKEKIKLELKYKQDAIREFWKIMQTADAFLVANSVNDPWGCDDKQARFMFDKLGGAQIIRNDGHFGSTYQELAISRVPIARKNCRKR